MSKNLSHPVSPSDNKAVAAAWHKLWPVSDILLKYDSAYQRWSVFKLVYIRWFHMCLHGDFLRSDTAGFSDAAVLPSTAVSLPVNIP